MATPRARPRETGSPMRTVYDGQTCVGFVLARGKVGLEAFDADNRRLRMFAAARAAAAAISGEGMAS
jgi:hypothetical protein